VFRVQGFGGEVLVLVLFLVLILGVGPRIVVQRVVVVARVLAHGRVHLRLLVAPAI